MEQICIKRLRKRKNKTSERLRNVRFHWISPNKIDYNEYTLAAIIILYSTQILEIIYLIHPHHHMAHFFSVHGQSISYGQRINYCEYNLKYVLHVNDATLNPKP